MNKRNANEHYCWHLRWPGFEHLHWWSGEPDIVAAWWEIVRRHPKALGVRAASTVWAPDTQLKAILAARGLDAWPSLKHDQQWWREAIQDLPPQTGFDPRIGVYSVTSQSIDIRTGANPNALVNPQAREAEIAQLSVEHHRAGRVLIAIEPNVGNIEEAEETVLRCCREYWAKVERGRGRPADWLKNVRVFEEEEIQRNAKKQKRNKDLFKSYREAIDRVLW
jgi:hypothetical protein